MNLLNQIKDKVGAAFQAAGLPPDNTLVRLSDRPDIGDYQANGALPLAKTLHQNPRALAEKVADRLRADPFFKKVSVDGHCFINMQVSDETLGHLVYPVLADSRCGYERPDTPKTVFLDYGGPNVAKALHVGHLRPALIGEAVKRICAFVGDKTIADVHLGDWGKPMGLLIAALQDRQPDLPYFDSNHTGDYPAEAPFTGHDLEVMYPLASQRAKEDPAFAERAHTCTRLLQDGHPGYRALWEHFVRLSVADIRRLYDELGVSFDLWRGESHVHDRLWAMIKRLRANGTIIPDQGAEIIPLGQAKSGNDLPPLIMVKSDGAVMYAATDLATIEERMDEFHPDAILYAVDARQALHFEQVFTGARKIGLADGVSLEHLGFGTINGTDNKPFKTRDGGIPTLRYLIDTAVRAARKKMEAGEMGRDLTPAEQDKIAHIVGVSALKFADLSNERMKNYVFDEDKLTSTEGKTGPYLLYAMVRMKSVLAKMQATATLSPDDAVRITDPAERHLLLRLYALPDSVQTAYDNRAPHVLADYLFKLAQDFNLFYHDCPIKGADPETQKSRLTLTKYTLHVASTIADVLGLTVPDKM